MPLPLDPSFPPCSQNFCLLGLADLDRLLLSPRVTGEQETPSFFACSVFQCMCLELELCWVRLELTTKIWWWPKCVCVRERERARACAHGNVGHAADPSQLIWKRVVLPHWTHSPLGFFVSKSWCSGSVLILTYGSRNLPSQDFLNDPTFLCSSACQCWLQSDTSLYYFYLLALPPTLLPPALCVLLTPLTLISWWCLSL